MKRAVGLAQHGVGQKRLLHVLLGAGAAKEIDDAGIVGEIAEIDGIGEALLIAQGLRLVFQALAHHERAHRDKPRYGGDGALEFAFLDRALGQRNKRRAPPPAP